MEQKIIDGKVYFVGDGGYLGNLEVRKMPKSWREAGITREEIWKKGKEGNIIIDEERKRKEQIRDKEGYEYYKTLTNEELKKLFDEEYKRFYKAIKPLLEPSVSTKQVDLALFFIKGQIQKLRDIYRAMIDKGITPSLEFNLGSLDNLEKSIFKKVGKGLKKGVKAVGKGVSKGVKSVGKITGKVVKNPLALATATYFGLPMLSSTVLPAVGSVGKTLLSKMGSTSTGLWWVKQGKKIFRVFKSPSKKTITQEIKEDNPAYKDLISQLPDGVIPNSEVSKKIEEKIGAKIPFPIPSGLPVEDVKKLQENEPEAEPMTEEYQPDKVVEVSKDAEVSVKKPVDTGNILPYVAGAGLIITML
jgi:hypothetical protein